MDNHLDKETISVMSQQDANAIQRKNAAFAEAVTPAGVNRNVVGQRITMMRGGKRVLVRMAPSSLERDKKYPRTDERPTLTRESPAVPRIYPDSAPRNDRNQGATNSPIIHARIDKIAPLDISSIMNGSYTNKAHVMSPVSAQQTTLPAKTVRVGNNTQTTQAKPPMAIPRERKLSDNADHQHGYYHGAVGSLLGETSAARNVNSVKLPGPSSNNKSVHTCVCEQTLPQVSMLMSLMDDKLSNITVSLSSFARMETELNDVKKQLKTATDRIEMLEKRIHPIWNETTPADARKDTVPAAPSISSTSVPSLPQKSQAQAVIIEDIKKEESDMPPLTPHHSHKSHDSEKAFREGSALRGGTTMSMGRMSVGNSTTQMTSGTTSSFAYRPVIRTVPYNRPMPPTDRNAQVTVGNVLPKPQLERPSPLRNQKAQTPKRVMPTIPIVTTPAPAPVAPRSQICYKKVDQVERKKYEGASAPIIASYTPPPPLPAQIKKKGNEEIVKKIEPKEETDASPSKLLHQLFSKQNEKKPSPEPRRRRNATVRKIIARRLLLFPGSEFTWGQFMEHISGTSVRDVEAANFTSVLSELVADDLLYKEDDQKGMLDEDTIWQKEQCKTRLKNLQKHDVALDDYWNNLTWNYENEEEEDGDDMKYDEQP